MNKKLINDAATAYAKDQLGDKQFKENKDAVKSIETDFKDGAKYLLDNFGAVVGSSALQSVIIERAEQIHKHGKTIEDDRTKYKTDEMVQVAIALIDENAFFPANWNVEACTHMHEKPLRERLIYAASFLIAEADRITTEE